jgi:ATP/maltotriose-dependent transcriptional regulator MalT
MTGGTQIPADRTDEGWALLQERQWGAARAAFQTSLARAETPEAWEGSSWASWWLDDAGSVFSARERAYRLYRQRGDAASAARMATWLASDALDFHGATAVARGWLQRAHRLLDPLDAGPDHGWLAFHEGYIALVGGDPDACLQRAVDAATLGRRFEVADLEMLGLALEGSVLVGRAEVDEGMRRLDEATAVALEGQASVPISSAWACCFLVSACTAVRDYERAFAWCDRIAEFAERHESRYMLAFCRAEYGAVELCRGRWPEAERMLDAAVEDFSRSRPALVGSALVALAELRRRQGRPVDAARLLDRAGATSAAQLCRARIALDRADARAAAELAERVLRQVPEPAQLARLPALELLVRARIALGELDAAAHALEGIREVARRVRTAPLGAAADLAEGLLVAARGAPDAARALLEDAADRFERSGMPFEAAGARIELAASLAALGRVEVAGREAAAARRSLLELGAATEAERAGRVLDVPAGRQDGRRDLTPREWDVLALLAEGLTNRQIADRLVVSEHTVHRHVTNILRKLDLPSRAAAAAFAVRAGLPDAWVTPSESTR